LAQKVTALTLASNFRKLHAFLKGLHLEATLVRFIDLLRLQAQLLPPHQLPFQVLLARFSVQPVDSGYLQQVLLLTYLDGGFE
jgi:hypothetical protein